jgi:alcohol dehydrogenase (cytochrome c)
MRQSRKPFSWTAMSAAVAATFALTVGAGVAQAGVTDKDIVNDAATPEDVVSFGMGTQGQRFSSLDQVNVNTVKDLVPAWTMSFGGEKQRGQESQPLVSDGVLYVTASYSRMFAFDVKTGKKLWKYEHRLPDGIMPCCDVVNRGAALYGDLVIFGTLDAQIVALNRETGKVVWKEKVDDYKAGYSMSAAPIIVKGMVITGVSGGEFGVVGRLEARDANTGKLVWIRPTVEGHMGYTFDAKGNKTENGISGNTNATWPGDLWKTGGAATWNGATYDPETNLIFVGTGNPSPWNSHLRGAGEPKADNSGDNLFAASTVAINPDNGKIVWHYQTTPREGWDFDGVNEFVSFDYKDPKSGKTIKAGGKADRNGFFYVIDRTNGKLLNAFPFVKKITWAKGIDLETGRPIYNEDNRPGDPSKGADGKKGTTVFAAPSFLGGKNQMQISYNPDTGLFYVPANEWGMDIWNEPVAYKKGAAYLGAGFTIKPLHDDYIGALRAIDPAAGKIVWENTNYAPLWGGTLTTRGGLTFYGTPEGYLKALDAKTGKEVWSFMVGIGIVAPPIIRL